MILMHYINGHGITEGYKGQTGVQSNNYLSLYLCGFLFPLSKIGTKNTINVLNKHYYCITLRSAFVCVCVCIHTHTHTSPVFLGLFLQCQ